MVPSRRRRRCRPSPTAAGRRGFVLRLFIYAASQRRFTRSSNERNCRRRRHHRGQWNIFFPSRFVCDKRTRLCTYSLFWLLSRRAILYWGSCGQFCSQLAVLIASLFSTFVKLGRAINYGLMYSSKDGIWCRLKGYEFWQNFPLKSCKLPLKFIRFESASLKTQIAFWSHHVWMAMKPISWSFWCTLDNTILTSYFSYKPAWHNGEFWTELSFLHCAGKTCTRLTIQEQKLDPLSMLQFTIKRNMHFAYN